MMTGDPDGEPCYLALMLTLSVAAVRYLAQFVFVLIHNLHAFCSVNLLTHWPLLLITFLMIFDDWIDGNYTLSTKDIIVLHYLI